MSDEDLLRSGLAGLGRRPTLPQDRLGGVHARIRRRARRRAALAGTAAVAVLGVLGTLVLPGLAGDRDTLPGRSETADQREDYRVTITQALVALPGTPLPEAVERVSAALEPTGLGRIVRSSENGRQDGPVRVDFDRRLEDPERDRVRHLLTALPSAEVVVRDIPGFHLVLVVPLSEAVRTELEQTGAVLPTLGPSPLGDVLGGYAVYPDADEQRRQMTVEYRGPALSETELAIVRAELARVAGVRVQQVRMEAGRQSR